MPDLVSLFSVETARDWAIIFMGVTYGAFFFVALILLIAFGLVSRGLFRKTSTLMNDHVAPLLDTVKDTATNARATSSYMSDAAVTPVVRAYGVVAGVRRAASVIAGLTGAGGEKPKQ